MIWLWWGHIWFKGRKPKGIFLNKIFIYVWCVFIQNLISNNVKFGHVHNKAIDKKLFNAHMGLMGICVYVCGIIFEWMYFYVIVSKIGKNIYWSFSNISATLNYFHFILKHFRVIQAIDFLRKTSNMRADWKKLNSEKWRITISKMAYIDNNIAEKKKVQKLWTFKSNRPN